MFIYSKKIIQFVSEIKKIVKEVLSKEVGLKIHGERFYNREETCSFPISIVVFNNKSMLGFFDPDFYQMGFHERLMYTSKEQLRCLIRHEIAHYLTFICHGTTFQPHGSAFKTTCENLGWGEEVSKASFCLEEGEAVNIEESGVFRKVQKLMALATSSNKNEAEQAMIKSQQLLLKHNIESKYIDGEEEEKIYVKRIMKQKRENAKMRSIAIILETFFVGVVYVRGGDFIYLEILGSAVNLEIAEYVANFLDQEMDNLWDEARRYSYVPLKGAVAKNSFFLGLAKGYCNKIQALKREYDNNITQALLVIEKKLVDARAMVYPRLTSTKSQRSHCQQSSALGEMMGRQLSIHPAVGKTSTNPQRLLS